VSPLDQLVCHRDGHSNATGAIVAGYDERDIHLQSDAAPQLIQSRRTKNQEVAISPKSLNASSSL
jgi:hypothetical protein